MYLFLRFLFSEEEEEVIKRPLRAHSRPLKEKAVSATNKPAEPLPTVDETPATPIRGIDIIRPDSPSVGLGDATPPVKTREELKREKSKDKDKESNERELKSKNSSNMVAAGNFISTTIDDKRSKLMNKKKSQSALSPRDEKEKEKEEKKEEKSPGEEKRSKLFQKKKSEATLSSTKSGSTG